MTTPAPAPDRDHGMAGSDRELADLQLKQSALIAASQRVIDNVLGGAPESDEPNPWELMATWPPEVVREVAVMMAFLVCKVAPEEVPTLGQMLRKLMADEQAARDE